MPQLRIISADHRRQYLRLGVALGSRAEECTNTIEARMSTHPWVGRAASDAYRERVRNLNRFAVLLVSRWLVSGILPDAAEVAWISERAQLAATEHLAMVNIIRAYVIWRNTIARVIIEEAGRQRISGPVRDGALAMVRRYSDESLIGAAAAFDERIADIQVELEDDRKLILHHALHDQLTTLPNRTLLADRLAHAITASRRTQTPFSVLMLDLDGFKAVNDRYGHAVGDLCLREAALRLKAVLRASDTLARLGGDEFVALIPGADATAASAAATRMEAALRRPLRLDGHRVSVRASIGIATYPEDAAEATPLLSAADRAMYRAKKTRDDALAGGAAGKRPAPPQRRG